jgi:DNA-binding Lrp family transcriptional regulator
LTADVDLRPVTNCVTAFMTLNTRLADIKAVVEKLRDIDEVSEAYVTTGQHDVILKIYAPNMEALDLLVTERFSRIEGIEVAKSSFVIETAKDTVGPILRPGFGFRIKCDTCKGEIDCCVGLTKVFHGQERFFCGEQCLATFGRKS